MAWVFSKAENLLNTLDQSATNVLTPTQEKSRPSNGVLLSRQHSTELNNTFTPPSQLSTSSSAHNLTPTGLASTANIRRVPSDGAINTGSPVVQRSGVRKLRTDQDDEKLFEFLNKPTAPVAVGRMSSPLGGDKRKERKSVAGGATAIGVPGVNGRHSRQSSTSSTVSSKSTTRIDGSPTGSSLLTGGLPTGDDHPDSSEPPTVNNISDSDRCETTTNEVDSSSYPPPPTQEVGGPPPVDSRHAQQLSSLELENKLLKNEVASLNQEMGSALDRTRKAQDELRRVKEEIDHRLQQMASSHALLRQLQDREEDFTEELNAKNSQLAVLRVRLQEADGELKAKASQLEIVQQERDRILRDHSDSSGINSQALDSVRDKLQETESTLKREQDSYKVAQVEFMDRQGRIEAEQQNLAEALTATQKKYQEEKNSCYQFSQQLKTFKSQLVGAKEELSDYKQKATRILQSKDKLISSLKDGASLSDSTAASCMELEELRSDRDGLREEQQLSNERILQLRTAYQELEVLHQTESDAAQDDLRDLQDQLTTTGRQLRETESDLQQRSEELRFMEDDSHKTKMSLQARLQEKEQEINKLRNQLITKTASSASQTELESRLHSLTESLIQKQTLLEALSTEKNSLVMQLERVEKQYKETEQNATRSNSHAVTMSTGDDDEGTRQRGLPSFLRETPLDAGVTKNVKRAANTIDRFSIRLGVFLRRYPIARLFVIAYMVLLHLWVMVVLLTYTPEIHGSDFHPQGPN